MLFFLFKFEIENSIYNFFFFFLLKIVLKGYSTVELHRINGSQFGLTIAGGSDKESKARICDLKPGSIAHRFNTTVY